MIGADEANSPCAHSRRRLSGISRQAMPNSGDEQREPTVWEATLPGSARHLERLALLEAGMRNILFRGRAGRHFFVQYQKLPRISSATCSRAEARMARTAGMGLACVYIACLLLSAYAIA